MKVCTILDRVIFPDEYNESIAVTNSEYKLIYGEDPPYLRGSLHKNDEFRTDAHWMIPIPQVSTTVINVFDLDKISAAQLNGLLKNCLVKPVVTVELTTPSYDK